MELLTMTATLLRLANELISIVIEHVGDTSTLQAVTRTCSRPQQLTEPALYTEIFHRTGTQALRISDSVKACQRRAQAIKVIESRYRFGEEGACSTLLRSLRAQGTWKL